MEGTAKAAGLMGLFLAGVALGSLIHRLGQRHLPHGRPREAVLVFVAAATILSGVLVALDRGNRQPPAAPAGGAAAVTAEGAAGFLRWTVAPGQSLAPIIGGCRRGIYVLEFADGSQYVGQSVDVVTRYATHVHGSSHHAPWDDVVAVSFRAMPKGDLFVAEQLEIRRRHRKGLVLRNRSGIIGGEGDSSLDADLPVVDQEHWATGSPTYLGADLDVVLAERAEEASRFSGHVPSRHAEATYRRVLDDLGFLLTEVIPDAPALESRFWTLSDYPSTAGGRFATLNAGILELAAFPRLAYEWVVSGEEIAAPPEDHMVMLSFPAGWFLEEDQENLTGYGMAWEGPSGLMPADAVRHHYAIADTDNLRLPIGTVREYFAAEPKDLATLRGFTVDLMRHRGSGLFRRWHSPALVTEALRAAAAHRGA